MQWCKIGQWDGWQNTLWHLKNILTPFKKFMALDAETFKAGSDCFLRIMCLPYFCLTELETT